MKKLFYQLFQYYGISVYFTRAYAVHTTDGKTFKRHRACLMCGNIANAVGIISMGKTDFEVPICKPHAEKYLATHDPKLLDCIKRFPFRFKLNIKWVEK